MKLTGYSKPHGCTGYLSVFEKSLSEKDYDALIKKICENFQIDKDSLDDDIIIDCTIDGKGQFSSVAVHQPYETLEDFLRQYSYGDGLFWIDSVNVK